MTPEGFNQHMTRMQGTLNQANVQRAQAQESAADRQQRSQIAQARQRMEVQKMLQEQKDRQDLFKIKQQELDMQIQEYDYNRKIKEFELQQAQEKAERGETVQGAGGSWHNIKYDENGQPLATEVIPAQWAPWKPSDYDLKFDTYTGQGAVFNPTTGQVEYVNDPNWQQRPYGGTSSSRGKGGGQATQWMQGLPKEYHDWIDQYSRTAGVDPLLSYAVMLVESAGNPNAKSSAGATGLMQLMPGTAAMMGVNDPWKPENNIRGGTQYLGEQLKAFGGDISLALAAYNAGPGAVQKYGGIPPFKETQNYVNKVMGFYNELRGEGGGVSTWSGSNGSGSGGGGTAGKYVGQIEGGRSLIQVGSKILMKDDASNTIIGEWKQEEPQSSDTNLLAGAQQQWDKDWASFSEARMKSGDYSPDETYSDFLKWKGPRPATVPPMPAVIPTESPSTNTIPPGTHVMKGPDGKVQQVPPGTPGAFVVQDDGSVLPAQSAAPPVVPPAAPPAPPPSIALPPPSFLILPETQQRINTTVTLKPNEEEGLTWDEIVRRQRGLK